MSVYAAGAATFGTMGNAGVDIKLPSHIRDEIVTVAKQVAALGKIIDDATARGKVPADFLTGWGAFKSEWEAFARNHESWASRAWYASYEKTVEYRKRLEGFRQRFEQVTGEKVAYPSPGATPEGMGDKGEGFPWRFVAYGGIAIGAAYGIAKLLGETRALKREFIEGPLVRREHHHHHEAAP